MDTEPNKNVSDFSIKSKNIVAVLILLIFLVVLGFIFKDKIYSLFNQKPEVTSVPSNTLPPEQIIPITQIEDKSIPKALPSGIVTEKDIEVVQSYTAIVGDKEQSTYQYLSTKPLKEIIKAFDAFIAKSGWAIYNKQDLPRGFNYLYINQKGSMLTLSSVLNTDETKHLISITLVKKIN